MDQALEILPADYWRWWLLAHAPENSDAEFTWELFQSTVNKDLADVLGNFVSRITKFCRAKFGTEIPDGGTFGPEEEAVIASMTERFEAYQHNMDRMEVRKSAQELRAIWASGNEYLQTVAPWTTIKENPEKAAMQTRLGLNMAALFGTLSAPFIPDTAEKIAQAFPVAPAAWPQDIRTALTAMDPGQSFLVPDVLFAKISDEDRASWSERFAGGKAS